MLGLTHHEAIDLASSDKGGGSDRTARDMALALLSSYYSTDQIRMEHLCNKISILWNVPHGDTVVYFYYISLP